MCASPSQRSQFFRKGRGATGGQELRAIIGIQKYYSQTLRKLVFGVFRKLGAVNTADLRLQSRERVEFFESIDVVRRLTRESRDLFSHGDARPDRELIEVIVLPRHDALDEFMEGA